MPKNTNRVRNGSSQRRDFTPDQLDDQNSRSPNGPDSGLGDFGESQSLATALASSTEALQRLVNITRYFGTLTNEMDAVESVHGVEIAQEKKIRSLNEALETMGHHKSDKLEKLQAGEEARLQEIKRYQTLQAELTEQHKQGEVMRVEEFKKKLQDEKNKLQDEKDKLQDEKAKLQKSVKARKAEIEAGSKEKVQGLESQVEKLSAMKTELEQQASATEEELKRQLWAAEEKLKIKKIKHARNEKSLEDENKHLKEKLAQMKSEFPAEGQPVEYYTDKFHHISDTVAAVSAKFFQQLPDGATESPEAVHRELSRLDPIFSSMHVWESEVSQFLRVKAVEHVISTALCEFIWHPFFPQNALPNHPGWSQFLEDMSKSLSALGGRSESAWRALSLRGIAALGGTAMESRQAESMVQRVLKILRPLTSPSQSAEFENALMGIVKESVTLWKTAQTDEAKVVVEACPDASDPVKWLAEDMQGLVEASMPLDDKLDAASLQPQCIFPSIRQTTSRGETVLLHRGTALFPTSQVWIHGLVEQKEHEEELAKAILDARSKMRARRMSVPTGPNSPTAGKSPKT